MTAIISIGFVVVLFLVVGASMWKPGPSKRRGKHYGPVPKDTPRD